MKRRFRRAFPCAFLVLAVMAFVGGAIHAPANFDAVSYRLPRVLNWLAAGQWNWVHTEFQRLNTRAAGMEWVSAPVLLFLRTDRLLFLINIISFLMLPGLVFSLFTRMGVHPRVAWYWMWLAPTGYCFLFQAGSIANDSFGAFFALVALDFALRCKISGRISQLWLSGLAACLMTAVKTSNLALLLPWLIALLPALPLVRKRLVATAAVAAVGVVASFLPVAVNNLRYGYDWAGLKAEHTSFISNGSAALHVSHNVVLLAAQNFCPPLFPFTEKWNHFALKLGSERRRKELLSSFETGGALLHLSEMQMEEDAGLGMGVSFLLLISFLVKVRHLKGARENSGSVNSFHLTAVRLSPYVSLAVFMVKSGLSAIARLLTPFYLLLIPALLTGPAQSRLVRQKWWQRVGLLIFFVAGVMVVISPPRPLWPARTMLAHLNHGHSALIKRAQSVYDVYGRRPTCFDPLIAQLPPDATTLGLITFDDPEEPLWKPFGQRRILHFLVTDSTQELCRRGIKYVVLNPDTFREHSDMTIEQWLEKNHAETLRVVPLTLRASKGPVDWVIARLPECDGRIVALPANLRDLGLSLRHEEGERIGGEAAFPRVHTHGLRIKSALPINLRKPFSPARSHSCVVGEGEVYWVAPGFAGM